MNDGDWICSDPSCGNINFARRASCYRCNKERPEVVKPSKKKLGTEIGKSAAEKSRGLFNADDWQCNKCANVNWARRQTCNVCNAPKFGEVEARTGYGGGYNERGVVEYRRRDHSDDEYDEFGRKKRKRKSDSQEQVGITEGAAPKKLPSTMLPKETQMDHIPVPASKMTNTNSVKNKGSLSDGSVCDLPPLTKVAFRRNQLQTQTNYHRQDHMLPNYKANGTPTRKRFVSSGDRDQAASSGYETGSKRSKRSSIESNKPNNPVMENRVTSTNNDSVVYTFAGTTPADDFQVSYTIEERVKAAAFAIVYNNCKISTDKFESLYDKPAPDFKTIFSWRQRLLSTGCLIDSHVDTKKDINEKSMNTSSNSSSANNLTNNIPTNLKDECVKKVPNPDEIPIDSDSDHSLHNIRSISAETLLIPGLEKETRAMTSSASTVEGQNSQRHVRSRSASTHQRTRSSSRASQDSNYPDSDSEKQEKQIIPKNTNANKIQTKMSIQDSDSDSLSYNSEDENFLSRVYGEGKKLRRKFRRRSTLPNTKTTNYTSNIETPTFQGYSSGKNLTQPTLEPVNMYTSNLSIINVREHDSKLVDTDGGSIEYVPTKVGSTAKRNYQEFKDNVRRKGYWAKGNAATFRRNVNNIARPLPVQKPTNYYNNTTWNTNVNKQLTSDKSIVPPFKHVDHVTKTVYPIETKCYNSQTQKSVTDFTNNLDYTAPGDQYSSLDKLSQNNQMKIINNHEDSDRIFAVVQSSSKKNKSIMDIFETNETVSKSPEERKEINYDSILKRYESQWDEDDDELYKDSFDNGLSGNKVSTPPNVTVTSMHSPLSNTLYTTADRDSQSVTPNKSFDIFKEKQEMLLGLLKEIKVNKCQQLGELISPLKPCDPAVSESDIDDTSTFQNVVQSQNVRNSNQITAISREPSVEIIQTPNNQDNYRDLNRVVTKSNENKSPSKGIEILESVTIQPNHKYFVPTQTPNENVTNQLETVEIGVSIQKSTAEPVFDRSHEQTPTVPQLDLSNVLAGINTSDLLLAIQNLQQLKQNPLAETENLITEHNSSSEDVQHVETINLVNDEEWERETTRGESIERQLEQLDGNTGSTPFLSDIFDPGPVVIPPNVAKNLNLNLQSLNPDKSEKSKHLNENAPVIGNFKSFALPKPILLNRLKLTVKTTDKNPKKLDGKKKLKKKNKTQQTEDGAEQDDEDDEESGDEADLSKYDLWGSDEEKGTSSKKDDSEKPKATENAKEPAPQVEDNNGKNVSPDVKSNRRHRSSSSSSSTSSSSSSSQSSSQAPKNKFDDFNLNSERESSPKQNKSRSRSPRSRSGGPTRRKSRDSRSAGETRSHDSSRDKERTRDRREKPRTRDKERRYARDGHYGGRHR